jgi:hypothetical protein
MINPFVVSKVNKGYRPPSIPHTGVTWVTEQSLSMTG